MRDHRAESGVAPGKSQRTQGQAPTAPPASDGTRAGGSVDMGRLLFPLGLGTALSLMGDATLYTVLPTHTAEAGIALGGVGILLGVNRAIRLFLNGPAGLAYDRWPRRRLFIPALFIGALSTAIYAATHGFWPLLVGRLLWGLAWSGIWVGGATMILDAASPPERGRWTGLYQTWFFVGAALGSFGGGVLTDLLGYATTMWIGAALTAAGGVFALLLLPETARVRPRAAEDSVEHELPRSTGGRRRGRTPNRTLWLAASLQGVVRFVAWGVVSSTAGLLIQDLLRSYSVAAGVATVTGLVMAGRTLLSMVSAPLAGTLSDRMGSRWTVVGWSLATGVVAMGLLAWGGPAQLLIGVSALAIAGGGLQSLATTLTGDAVDRSQRGRAIGLLHTAGDLGSAIGPSIAYALLPVIGLPTMYLICAGLFAASLVPVLRIAGRQRRARPIVSQNTGA